MAQSTGCIFCDATGRKTDHHIIVKDKYPVTKGHLLVVPKRHLLHVSQYEVQEWADLQSAIREAKQLCSLSSVATDFNIGVNEGTHAGQTISHLHWHIIPRTEDDGGKPCGVRNVFPDEADYRKEALNNTEEVER
jgi:diadenosine tetraphosphate (Ap4A) HIT family hydrolase